MTEHHGIHHQPLVPEEERAHTVGATGGLPGANADPRTAEMPPEDIASTVAAGDAPGDASPDPADAYRDDDALTDDDARSSAADPTTT